MTDNYFSWQPFGLKISRKIELLALAAFLIATVTLISQIKGCLQGPEVVLFPPDQIFIFKDESYTAGNARVRFGSTMVYVNKGQKGYNGIVQFEKIRFNINGKAYEHFWERFCEFEGDPGNIEIKNLRLAKPFSVESGGTTSHQTYFIAWPKRCTNSEQGPCDPLENHAYWDDFVKELKRRVKAGETEYTFEFEVHVYNEATSKAACKISIDEPTVGSIELFKQYSPTCYSD